MGFRLTKYGMKELLLCTVLFVAACVLIIALAAKVAWPLAAIAILPLVVYGWVLWFFRDPQRNIPTGAGLLVAPADGTVTDITPLGPDSPLGCEGVQIGIFMSVFSVHVNRSPAAGRVEKVVHAKGLFLDARDPHAGEKNESTTIYMTCTEGGRRFPIVVRQIAGLIARRIITDISAGLPVQRGVRIGMIKFGSRAELLVPAEHVGKVRVEVGQYASAGETVLVELAAKE